MSQEITTWQIRDPGWLEQCIASQGLAALIAQLRTLLASQSQDPQARQAVRDVLEVLSAEAPSLDDWRPGQKVLSFANQLAFAADRLGMSGLFIVSSPNAVESWPGWLESRWSIGANERWLRQRLCIPGDRRSFGWDVYDAGPEGCRTSLWIDLPRQRLLTESVSSYSYGFSHESTYEWREWDLHSGLLVQAHTQAKIDSHKPQPVVRPPAFPDFVRRAEFSRQLPLAKIAECMGPDVAPSELAALGHSMNSSHVLVQQSRRRPGRPLAMPSRLWVWERDSGQAFLTNIAWDPTEFRIEAVAQLDAALAAWAVGSDEHIYRLRLTPAEPNDREVDPVLLAALDLHGHEIACLRSSGLELRDAATGQLRQKFALTDLTQSSRVVHQRSSVAMASTPDGRWTLVLGQSDHQPERLVPRPSVFVLDHQVHSTEPEVPTYSLQPVPRDYTGTWAKAVLPRGILALLHDRTYICVWETRSGRCLAQMQASHDLYGGGHSLHGLAVSADERFVISSDDGNTIIVWDLWDTRGGWDRKEPHWKLRGLGHIHKIHKLAFFWGSWLVAAVTEDHLLFVCRFWCDSQLLAAIRLPQMPRVLLGQPYGNRIYALMPSGRLLCLQYVPNAGPDVTGIRGNEIVVRCRAPGAFSVAVAGSFNGWDIARNSMQTRDGSIWETSLSLPDGHHEYKLVVDGQRWQLDPNVPFTPGPLGLNNYVDLPTPP